MPLPLAVLIYLLVCHPGPASHFSTFAHELEARGHTVEIFALDEVSHQFDAPVTSFSLKDKSAEEMADDLIGRCERGSVVITDVGHDFDEVFSKALLAQRASDVVLLAYYDNPEAFVPGNVFSLITRVMKAAQIVLFANKNLADPKNAEAQKIDLPFEKRMGIGFYPLEEAKKIEREKSRAAENRAAFFAEHSLEDMGQKILVYAGGCNEEYFTSAFPAFLDFLSNATKKEDLSDYVIVLQQHPRAKQENKDAANVLAWQKRHEGEKNCPTFIISTLETPKALSLAEQVLYHQTSMAATFALAGLPTLQVAEHPFNDLLVRSGLCAIANSPEELLFALKNSSARSSPPKEGVLEGLGIREDWADFVEFAINPHPYSTRTGEVRELANKLGIPQEQDLVAATQSAWLRTKGLERWQLGTMLTQEGQLVLQWAKEHGLFTTLTPRFTHYDSALILGATTSRMETRLSYLIELWNNGCRFEEVVFLTGERPLNKEVDHFVDLCDNEADAARIIWDTTLLPEGMKQLPVRFVAVPMKENGARPTTEDTLVAWLEESSGTKKALFVSDQPFCGYQGAVVEGSLPKTMLFDVVGRGIITEKEDFSDLLKTYPYAPKVILDSLARELYQRERNSRKEAS